MYRFHLDATDTFDFFMPERMVEALGVVVRGMLTVFAVLCMVWLALVLIRLLLSGASSDGKKKEEAPAAPAPAPAPVSAAPAQTDDALLVAIITAAIAARREGEGASDTGFRVVSFNRTKK